MGASRFPQPLTKANYRALQEARLITLTRKSGEAPCSRGSRASASIAARRRSTASWPATARRSCCCTAFRKISPSGRGSRPCSPSNSPSSAPICADRANYSFRAMAADQVALMKRLGFERFHLVGHDRGGRTGHRLALDRPDAVISLAVLDIVPTYAMFMDTNRHVAGAYWHWYFLSLPEPFPERLIGTTPIISTRP